MKGGPPAPGHAATPAAPRRVQWIDRQVSLTRALTAYGIAPDEAKTMRADAMASGRTRFEFTAQVGPKGGPLGSPFTRVQLQFPAVVQMHWNRRGWYVDIYLVL